MRSVPRAPLRGPGLRAAARRAARWRHAGRHPELRWTCRYEDIAACAALQRSLLVRCIGRLRPGGRLVYAVCSLEPEEGPELVKAVAAEHGLHVELEQAWTPEQEATDGFYLARLRLS